MSRIMDELQHEHTERKNVVVVENDGDKEKEELSHKWYISVRSIILLGSFVYRLPLCAVLTSCLNELNESMFHASICS